MGPKKKTILGLLVFTPLWVIKSAHCIIECLYWKIPAFLFQIPLPVETNSSISKNKTKNPQAIFGNLQK
jgi:hypothetical protein